MAASDATNTLAADESLRLADFARACKAAARVVALYPETHPAIRLSLGRVSAAASRLRGPEGIAIAILPDSLAVDGRSASKADGAIAELAVLLHAHLIGELRLTADPREDDWHRFLSLVARPPEEIRSLGGITQAWMAAGSGAIELRQIDYAEVLRRQTGAFDSDWAHIVANYLESDLSNLDDEALAALLEISQDLTRFASFTEELVAKASEGGKPEKQEVVLRILQALADFAARQHPEQLDRLLHQIAGVTSRLTPEIVLMLLGEDGPRDGETGPGIDLATEITSRLAGHTIAEFVAQAVSRDHGATGRLALAFTALVPDARERDAVLGMAADAASRLPIGQRADFRQTWEQAVEMLTTYSDEKYVSDAYGRELAAARAHAIDVERAADDPPARISTWRGTVSEDAVRSLDHRVLVDLLAIERRPDAWPRVLEAAAATVQQLVWTENVALACTLLEAIGAAAADGEPFAVETRAVLDRLRRGELMRSVITFIKQAPVGDVEIAAALCRALGPVVIGTLAEALASEQGTAVKRLRDVLLSFGPAGRAYADELRASPNAAARRTAIDILRAFGGTDALPDLATLMDDSEAAVQRDAIRAIVQIGTEEAYAVLQQALTSGGPRTREAIMSVLLATRDEGAAPLFVYILQHSDHRGSLQAVYLSTIQALGKLRGDAASAEALRHVLHRGEWWAPVRTRRLRMTAAAALRACGSSDAQRVLEEAAAAAARGVRRAARAALNDGGVSSPAREAA